MIKNSKKLLFGLIIIGTSLQASYFSTKISLFRKYADTLTIKSDKIIRPQNELLSSTWITLKKYAYQTCIKSKELGNALAQKIIPTVYAEEIVYKNHNGKIEPLSNKEYEKAFEILMLCRFPMNTQDAVKKYLEEKYSQRDIDLMLKDEIAFVQKELKKINRNIKALFIPTTLYELYLSKQNNLPSKYNQRQLRTGSDFIYAEDEKEFLNVCSENNKENIKFHKTLNDLVIKYLTNTYPKTFINTTLDPNNAENMAAELTDFWSNFTKQNGRVGLQRSTFDDNVTKEISENKDLIIAILKKEYLAQKNGDFLLFRGSNERIDSSLISEDAKTFFAPERYSHTLSFGNSLFAGARFDTGACAFSFMSRDINGDKQTIDAYAVKISKQKYYKNKLPHTLFYIPPIPTIQGAIGSSGEKFHPRSRIVTKKCLGFWNTILYEDFIAKKITINDKNNSHQNDEQKEQAFEDELQNYLRDHKILIKQSEVLCSGKTRRTIFDKDESSAVQEESAEDTIPEYN